MLGEIVQPLRRDLRLTHAWIFLTRQRHSSWSGSKLCPAVELLQLLLHENFLAGLVECALHAHALAFELCYVRLMIDVVHLARIILQHILVALLLNRARENLASTRCS